MLVAPGERHVLFLQGPGSFFFLRLAQACKAVGMAVSKINLCAGDYVFWPSGTVTPYRGPFADWPAFIEHYLVSNGVSDVVLFSDSRPYHRIATDIAHGLGINVFVFENGYFRPDWITFELGGVNGRSPFPKDPGEIMELARKTAREVQPTRNLRRTRRLILGDVAFHIASWLGRPVFPRYERFRKPHPVFEAVGWVYKGLQRPGKKVRAQRNWQQVRSSGRKLFFYPLQLDHDFQLIVDSQFSSLSEATMQILDSFARHAPRDAMLVVKNHPRDNNLIDREKEVRRLADRFAIADRVVFLETGSNPDIFEHCCGMVTINSTMGTSALFHDVPVCVLGRAVYDIDGLTHRSGLDSFWTMPTPPDPTLFQAFRRAIIQSAQVQGEFGATGRNEQHFADCVLKVHMTQFRPAGLNLVRNIARTPSLEPFPPETHGVALRGFKG